MPRPAKLKTPERDVLAQCLETLRLFPCVHAWRSNTGAAWRPTLGGGARPIRFGIPGQADIIGIVNPTGRFLAIECKSDEGRQSPEQRAFEAMVRDAGGIYLLVRSPQEMADELMAAGVRPRGYTTC